MRRPVSRSLLPEFIASRQEPPPPRPLPGDLTVGPIVKPPVPVFHAAHSGVAASVVPLTKTLCRCVLPPELFEELRALKDSPVAQLHLLSGLLFATISGLECRFRGLDGNSLLDEMLVIIRGRGDGLSQELACVLAGLLASANRNHPVLPKITAALADLVASCPSSEQAAFLVAVLHDVALAHPNPELAAMQLRTARMIDDLHGRYPGCYELRGNLWAI